MSPVLKVGFALDLFARSSCLLCVCDLWEAAFSSLAGSIEVVMTWARSVVLLGRVVLKSRDSGVAFVARDVDVFRDSCIFQSSSGQADFVSAARQCFWRACLKLRICTSVLPLD